VRLGEDISGLAGKIVKSSRISKILVLGMFGLVIIPDLPKFAMQGWKGGDFLSGFLKKYYLTLAWRITLNALRSHHE
jgi:hypothetical protein